MYISMHTENLLLPRQLSFMLLTEIIAAYSENYMKH